MNFSLEHECEFFTDALIVLETSYITLTWSEIDGREMTTDSEALDAMCWRSWFNN